MQISGQLNCPMSGKKWIFTGGGHAAGGFTQNQGFRNTAGLFEEVIRWNMRVDGDITTRENFVINTARSGYNIFDILREYDKRVSRYCPAAVVYLSGEEDRCLSPHDLQKGLAELRCRTLTDGAVLFELPEEERDSLTEANCLLEAVNGQKITRADADRKRLSLTSSAETFARSGKLVLKPEPMRWLFIGDSITHGALHTRGYDSLPQLWEKYLREDWNRRDDIVLNTAVSGATAGEFLERLDIRYTPYADADVVAAMFGTNDCCFPDTITPALFRQQLCSIVDMVHSHGSQMVLRTPQPQMPEAASRAKAIIPFVQAVRETASEKHVLLTDHFRNFTMLQHESPERFTGLMSDAVHPNAQGQYRMFREMAYAVDMVLDHSMVSLDYAER